MSPNDILTAAGEVIIITGVLFIGYRAFRLRSVLVDRPYRTRALGTGVGALTVIAFLSAGFLDSIFGETPTTAEGVLVEAVAWGFAFIGLLVWFVTNNDVAVAADYFNRDVLFWRRGGKWVTVGGVLVVYTLASVPSWWVPPQIYNNALLGTFFNGVFFVAAAYAAAVLAITYRRMIDRTTRTYTKWAVLSILLFWGAILLSGTGTIVDVVGLAITLAYLYSMNHTVTTLAIRTRTLPT